MHLAFKVRFAFPVDPKTNDENAESFLPTVAGKKCFIPFLIGQNDSFSDSMDFGSDDEKAFAMAIMSSAKCRILIGKNIIPVIEAAYFEGTGDQNYQIPFFDYGGENCLEIPFTALLAKGLYKFDRIVVVKG